MSHVSASRWVSSVPDRGKPSFGIDRFRGLRASPDRRSLSFTSVAGVHLLDLASGQARVTRVLSVSAGRGAPSPTVENIAWSPDGTQLAVGVRATRLDTFIIENPLALAGVVDATVRK